MALHPKTTLFLAGRFGIVRVPTDTWCSKWYCHDDVRVLLHSLVVAGFLLVGVSWSCSSMRLTVTMCMNIPAWDFEVFLTSMSRSNANLLSKLCTYSVMSSVGLPTSRKRTARLWKRWLVTNCCTWEFQVTYVAIAAESRTVRSDIARLYVTAHVASHELAHIGSAVSWFFSFVSKLELMSTWDGWATHRPDY